MKNMDETYCINIRNTLVFREGTVRVDADGNLLSLAVLSEGFYCALLNKLMGWNLINANSEKQNASGIDLIDREKKIAVQVSLTCDHKKVQHSIDKFKIDSYDGWHFYFVPLKMDSPNFRKDFTLPEGVIFNEKEDVLSISRIMRIIEQEADIDKQREISVLMDKYIKESDPRSNKDTIELVEQRKQHVEQNTEEKRSTREGKKATELKGSKNLSTAEKLSALDSKTNSASKPTLFLSYCSKDECIANLIENTLNVETNNGIIVSRYTRVPYRQSFKDFMKSIPEHDYVLCIVSDSYLKSQACMYEVGEIVKSQTYKQKLLFVVLNEADRKYYSKDYDGAVGATSIYGGAIKKLEYTEFWKEKYYELEGKIDSLDDKEATASATAELKEIGRIYRNDINEFLDFLAEYNGKSFEELYSGRFNDIIKHMISDWDSLLVKRPDIMIDNTCDESYSAHDEQLKKDLDSSEPDQEDNQPDASAVERFAIDKKKRRQKWLLMVIVGGSLLIGLMIAIAINSNPTVINGNDNPTTDHENSSEQVPTGIIFRCDPSVINVTLRQGEDEWAISAPGYDFYGTQFLCSNDPLDLIFDLEDGYQIEDLNIYPVDHFEKVMFPAATQVDNCYRIFGLSGSITITINTAIIDSDTQ